MNPFVSIIVPVYNVEKYIKCCIESIIRNNNSDYEIILVDDGSKDNSGEICERYAKKYNFIKVIHKVNGGLSDARNAGLKIANGDYILFVDGDDYVNGALIKKIKDDCILQGLPDVVFLGAFKVFPNNKKEQLDDAYIANMIVGKNSIEVLKYIASLKKYPASVCTKLISRKLIEKNALYFEYGKKSEDLDWTKKLLFAANSFGVCNVNYYYYRQLRTGSISNTLGFDNFKDIMEVIENWKKEAVNLNDEKKYVLLSFAAYEYKILLTIYPRIQKTQKNLRING